MHDAIQPRYGGACDVVASQRAGFFWLLSTTGVSTGRLGWVHLLCCFASYSRVETELGLETGNAQDALITVPRQSMALVQVYKVCLRCHLKRLSSRPLLDAFYGATPTFTTSNLALLRTRIPEFSSQYVQLHTDRRNKLLFYQSIESLPYRTGDPEISYDLYSYWTTAATAVCTRLGGTTAVPFWYDARACPHRTLFHVESELLELQHDKSGRESLRCCLFGNSALLCFTTPLTYGTYNLLVSCSHSSQYTRTHAHTYTSIRTSSSTSTSVQAAVRTHQGQISYFLIEKGVFVCFTLNSVLLPLPNFLSLRKSPVRVRVSLAFLCGALSQYRYTQAATSKSSQVEVGP